jgi:predicted nucleic acid-binding protein
LIIVDSSVWIDNLRGTVNDGVRKLQALDPEVEEIVVGDLILMEVLMGAGDEAKAVRLHQLMTRFPVVPLAGQDVAEEAARLYRQLRRLGVTVRTGIDMLIGAWCLRHGATLLHSDPGDFAPMQRHLGLIAL